MKRRDFLKSMVLGDAARLARLAAMPREVFVAPVSTKERSNVLWLSMEDIAPHLGCYGDLFATTLHILQHRPDVNGSYGASSIERLPRESVIKE